MKSRDEIKELHKEIKKRDKLIDELKEKNLVLLRTSLKKGEQIKELQDMIDKLKQK
jgi:hypothetical protein